MVEIDRRVARTRRLLAAALVELVNEQDYESITIRDITDHADIGYATFFRHYNSKDDLMLEIFTRIIDELESLSNQRAEHSFEQEGRHFFQHVAENAALYRSILDSLPFARKLRDNIVQRIRGHLESHAKEIPEPVIPVDIAAQHLVSSILGLVDWWLANDIPYPVEQMALIYERLTVRATLIAMIPENQLTLPLLK